MKRFAALFLLFSVLAAYLTLTAGASGSDFDLVTAHAAIAPAKELSIFYPAADVETTASGFQITGSSNPELPLALNGQPVENRGSGGSFAVYVPLENGENTFTFRQGESSQTVTITKGKRNSPSTAAANQGEAPKPLPQYDVAIESGKSFSLKCYAPSATGVTATIAGTEYNLEKSGSYFTGSYKVPSVEGTSDLGPVQYTVTGPSGAHTEYSDGNLFAVAQDATLQIEIVSVSTTVFEAPSLSSGSIATAKQGARAEVTGHSGGMYQLATGGWVAPQAARPLTSAAPVHNQVDAVSLSLHEQGETFVFTGTSHPLYQASQTAGSLRITFFNTGGLDAVDVTESTLFSSSSVTQKDGHTTIDLSLSSPDSLWGYLVEYENGQTRLLCRPRPILAENSAAPLQGLTIAVDAGHGGTDAGALGLTYGHGPTEKDVNLATAIALQSKLELLGAQVVMLRQGDVTADLNSRMAAAQTARADFIISLHANSVAYSSTASSPNGVEVYYHEPISKSLARTINNNIASATGRTSRGAKYHASFVMTHNSYAPSVLVEMGFMLNPADFDSMCSKQGIYDTVTAIADSIVQLLR